MQCNCILYQRVRVGVLIALSLLVLWLCWESEWRINEHWFRPHGVLTIAETRALHDVDHEIFLRQVATFPTLESTVRLWRMVLPGVSGYWRPLLMWGFWAEYQFFGPDNYTGYIGCLMVSHLLFLCIFGAFIKHITNSWSVALLAVLIFAGCRALPPMSLVSSAFSTDPLWTPGTTSDGALTLWKDQAEMWHGGTFILALLAAMHRRWYAGIAAFACAVMFKESGWLAPVMVLILLAIDGRVKEVPLAVWITFAIVAALLIAGKLHIGLNLTQASNFKYVSGIPFRYFHLVAGRGMAALTQASWPAAVVGGWLGASLSLLWHKRVNAWEALALWVLVSAVAIAGWAHGTGHGLDVALVTILTPECMLPVLVSECVYAFCAVTMLLDRRNWRPLGILIILSAIAALPTIVNPWETPHIYYFTNSFQASIVAFVWVAMLRRTVDARKITSPQRIDTPA